MSIILFARLEQGGPIHNQVIWWKSSPNIDSFHNQVINWMCG